MPRRISCKLFYTNASSTPSPVKAHRVALAYPCLSLFRRAAWGSMADVPLPGRILSSSSAASSSILPQLVYPGYLLWTSYPSRRLVKQDPRTCEVSVAISQVNKQKQLRFSELAGLDTASDYLIKPLWVAIIWPLPTFLYWLHRDIMIAPRVQTSPLRSCEGNSGPCQWEVPQF